LSEPPAATPTESSDGGSLKSRAKRDRRYFSAALKRLSTELPPTCPA
jgi:hypothetical protein